MKRRMAAAYIFCLILAGTETVSAQEKGLGFGFGVTSALKGWAEFVIDYRISEHWSVHAAAGFNARRMISSKAEEFRNHNTEFEDSIPEISISKGMHQESISFRYWPTGVYDGLFFSIGGENREYHGADGQIGTGYSFTIYKGLSTDISYNLRLRESISSDTVLTGEICINLSYRF